MSKKNKRIPELRFPEFKNEEEWKVTPIGKVFNSFSGGTPNTSEKDYYGGDIPFIRSAEINKNETELFLTKKGIENSSAKYVKKGDLLVALYGANSGDSAISKINGAINQAILCLQSDYSNVYTYNFLTLKKDWIVSKFIQGGQGNLSGDIVKSILIPFPKKFEQQKIASCLSSLDDLIESHNQKLDLLKDHKKGLMQNLFPQKGKKVPKLRFKEFENDGEWEIKTLSGICDITNGKANAQDHVDNGRYPLFDRSEVIKASDEFIFDCEAVIIPGEGMKFIPKYYEGKFNLHQRAYALKDFSCSGQFVYYFMLHRSTLLSQKAVQSTVLSLRLPILQDFPIEIPKKPEEQEKIASCLSSLDEVISAHNQKLELLKAHKKGLMQGLFPKNY